VHDKIAVILENPLGVLVAFNADGQLAAVFHLEVDLVTDCLVLASIGAGADQEVIGEGGDLSEVEDDNVLSLFRLRGSDGCKPTTFSGFWGLGLRAVTWRLLG
jgi:hypothetical protein